MTTFKGIIFDFDGLLVNSEVVYEEGWFKGIEEAGLRDFDRTIIEGFAGQSVDANNQTLYEILGDHDMVSFIRNVRERYFFDQVESNKVDLMPYAKEFLEFVKNSGYKLAVASASVTERIYPLLINHGIEDMFDAVVAGDLVKNSKPAPDVYLKALEKLGLEKDEVIVFEDSNTGVESAKNAGLKVYQIKEGKDFNNLKEAYESIWQNNK